MQRGPQVMGVWLPSSRKSNNITILIEAGIGLTKVAAYTYSTCGCERVSEFVLDAILVRITNISGSTDRQAGKEGARVHNHRSLIYLSYVALGPHFSLSEIDIRFRFFSRFWSTIFKGKEFRILYDTFCANLDVIERFGWRDTTP